MRGELLSPSDETDRAVIYLDHNAATPIHPEALAAMLPYFSTSYGNPASTGHALGRAARRAVEEARAQVAGLLGAAPEEIVFTSGGSEGDSQAILDSGPGGGPHPRIVTSNVEHRAVEGACRWSCDRFGTRLEELPVDLDGLLQPDELERALRREPATLVSVAWASNETGVVQPIAELAGVARRYGARFHTDAVQAAGKMPIDLSRTAVDLLTLAAHKLGGPKGVGALFVRRGVEMAPRIFGGGQERGLRSGTENVPLIVGFGHACEAHRRDGWTALTKIRALRDRLEVGLLERCPGAVVAGRSAPRLANTLAIGWPFLHAEELIRALDREEVCAGAGSACTSLHSEPSRVLLAMGLAPELARGTIRFSLGFQTTKDEIDRVIEVMAYAIRDLRREAD